MSNNLFLLCGVKRVTAMVKFLTVIALASAAAAPLATASPSATMRFMEHLHGAAPDERDNSQLYGACVFCLGSVFFRRV